MSPATSLLRSEQGSTLVASILVTLIVAVLGATSLRVATHTNDATTLDRQRSQSLQAAEAGVNASLQRLEKDPWYLCDTLSGPADMRDGSRVLSKYQVRVDLPNGECFDEAASLEREIRSWGYAPVESERSLRHVLVEARLIPQDGFRFALFAAGEEGIVFVKNTSSVDGDIYAENLDVSKNNLDANDVISTGSVVTDNNASYTGSVWAGGDVTLGEDSEVAGSVLAAGSSAPGDVQLDNEVEIGRDVRAKGSVTHDTATVHGSVSENNPSVPEPPTLTLPGFEWDPTNYDPSPTTFTSASDASDHLASNQDDLQGTIYVDDPSGTVAFRQQNTVTGPLTVVTTGQVDMGRVYNAVGGPHQVVIVSLSEGADAVNIHRLTGSPSLDMLLYTPGEVDIKNNTSFAGAIYADRIDIKNRLTLSHATSLATSPPVGFDFTQASAARFTVVPTRWREITPGPPPS